MESLIIQRNKAIKILQDSDSEHHCQLGSKAAGCQTLGATWLYSLLANADAEGEVG